MLGTTNQRLTYSPKLMHESDEQSPKRWWWHCSNCNHREEMSPSNLIKTYQTENKSFVRSLSSTKKKPDADLPSGATLTDDRNYPPPQ